MKSCAILVVIGCCLLNRAGAISILDNVASEEGIMELTRGFLQEFLLHFNGIPAKTDLKFPGVDIDGISFPILPPLPDPLILDDSETEIPEENGGPIHGFFNFWNSQITGLRHVVDNFTISPTPDYEFLFEYKINSPSEIVISGEHLANLTLVDLPAEILGSGNYFFGFTNPSIGLTMKVKILLSNGLSISSAGLDLAIGTVNASTSETTVNGEPIIWKEFSEQLTQFFPEIWAQAKPNVDAIVQLALSVVLEDCKVTDLITGNLDCIIPPRPPTTTPSTTDTTPPSSTPGFVSTTPSGGARTASFTTFMPLWFPFMAVVVKSFQIWSQ